MTGIALAVCAPWTIRNCARMGACGLSFNAGWNLLIGVSENATGAWAPVDVPAACRTVWDEAEKDACFGRAARRMIAERPGRFAALVPRKLAATFDYAGAPGFYLHASNPQAFGDGTRRRRSAWWRRCTKGSRTSGASLSRPRSAGLGAQIRRLSVSWALPSSSYARVRRGAAQSQSCSRCSAGSCFACRVLCARHFGRSRRRRHARVCSSARDTTRWFVSARDGDGAARRGGSAPPPGSP